MRKLIALFLFLFLCGAAFGQLSQFRMIGSGSWSVVNDSTFSSTVTIQSDLTSNGFLPTGITDTMKVFSQTGQRYRISSATNLTFSGADLIVVESGGDWGAPVGQILIYENQGREAVPSIPFSATGSTAKMQEAAVSYNSTLTGYVIDGDKGDILINGGNWVIDNNTIDQGNIVNNAVTNSKIATDAIDQSKILDGEVTPSEIQNTTVIPGSYTNINATIDEDGRITSASNGTIGGGQGLTTLDTTFTANYTASTDSIVNRLTSVTESNDIVITLPAPSAETVKNSYEVNQIDRNNDGLGFTLVQVDGIDYDFYFAGDTVQFISFTPDLDETYEFSTIYLNGSYRWITNKTTQDAYQVTTASELSRTSYPLNSLITVATTDEVFRIESTIPSGFINDGFSVRADNNSNYAVIQPTNGRYLLSSFGVSQQADTTLNYTRFQNAVNFAANAELYNDLDSFALSTSSGSVVISSDLKILGNNGKIKVFPDNATEMQNTFLLPTHNSNDVELYIEKLNIYGPANRGFNMDGTFSPGTIPDSYVIDSDGSSTYNVSIRLEDFNFYGYFPSGVQINSGTRANLSWIRGRGQCSQTNIVGAFGTGNHVYVEEVDFYGGSYEFTDIAGNDSYGVQAYFHPYVKQLTMKSCTFNDWEDGEPIARSYQHSSGSAYYGQKFAYDTLAVDFQILEGCTFNGSSDKAVVGSWYFPMLTVKNCVFNNSGDAIRGGVKSIDDCYFGINTNVAYSSSTSSISGNDVFTVNLRNSEFYGGSALSVDTSSINKLRGVINITNSVIDCSSNTFVTDQLVFQEDSSRININVEKSHIIARSASSVLLNPGNSFCSFKNNTLEIQTSSGRFFSLRTTEGSGKIVIENNTFINPGGVTSPIWFYSNNSANTQINPNSIIIRNNQWPKNQERIGFVYQDPAQAFRIPLTEGVYFDTVSTTTIPLDWNYDTYYHNNSSLTGAWIQRTSAPGDGITSSERIIGGDLYVIFTQNCTVSESGNFDIVGADNQFFNSGEKIKFTYNAANKKWERTGVSNPKGGANTIQASIDSLALTYALFPAITYTPTDSIPVDTTLQSFPITGRLNGDTLRQITYTVTKAPTVNLNLRVLIWDGSSYTAAFSGTIPSGQRSVAISGSTAVATDERIFVEILTDSGASGLDLELKFQKP